MKKHVRSILVTFFIVLQMCSSIFAAKPLDERAYRLFSILKQLCPPSDITQILSKEDEMLALEMSRIDNTEVKMASLYVLAFSKYDEAHKRISELKDDRNRNVSSTARWAETLSIALRTEKDEGLYMILFFYAQEKELAGRLLAINWFMMNSVEMPMLFKRLFETATENDIKLEIAKILNHKYRNAATYNFVLDNLLESGLKANVLNIYFFANFLGAISNNRVVGQYEKELWESLSQVSK